FPTYSREPGRGFAADKYVMLGRMIRGLPLLIMSISMAVCSAESVQVITAEDWARPRSGESLVRMPALKRTVRDYLNQKSNQESSQNDQRGQRIFIRHPRGEEGVLWAEELRGWLVALGIPSTDIALNPESSRIDAIELAVMDADN
ncbi:MAG: hypothetical protein KAR22_13885, partial [Gammaproteobacteria bacterium]|nr:hypothetical protein [Gammaproteobacteria bacterium]